MAVESSVRLKVDGTSAVSELRRVNTATVGVTKSVGLLTTALRAVPFLGIADAARRFLKGFAEADKAAAAVRTLGVDSEKLKRRLLAVSNETKGLVSQTQLLEASYDVASAGFNDAASAANILKAASLGAVGGLSDLNTVADATTSVLNAYGLSSAKASKIVDGFIQTQNDGKIVVGQYANQIGRVAPIAAAAGVGIDELNAAISAVTATGVPVESTFAGLRQAIAGVIKPTEEARKTSELLGLEFNSAAIKAKGFGGFLADVIQKTGGSEVALTKLFGSVEAVAAIMPLANDGLKKFNTSLENQKNSAGAAEKATKDLGGTVSSQVSSIIGNIGNVARALDVVLGGAIKDVTTDVNNLISAFSTAIQKFNDLITGKLEQASGRFQFFSMTLAQSGAGLMDIKNAVESLNPLVAGSTEELDRMQGALNRATNATRLVGSNAADGMKDLAQQTQRAILKTEKLINKRRKLLGEKGKQDGQGQTTPKVDPLIKELQERIRALLAAQDRKGNKKDSDKEAERIAEASADRVRSLEQATLLASALTDEERTQFERQIQIAAILENKRGLTEGQIKAELKATAALYEQQDATKAITEENKKQADAKAKAQAEEKKRADELKSVYQGIGDTIADGVTNALKGAVDGTKSLADAATSLLSDLANQLLQVARNMIFFGNITGSLTKGSGLLGSLFSGFLANGGTAMGGRSYVVGEKGPELFTPGRTGSVAPAGSFGAANIVVNVDASGTQAQGDQPNAKALGNAIGAAVQAELVRQKRPGGLLSS